MLTPRDSRSREYLRLDGLWRFQFDPGGGTGGEGHGAGTVQRWWTAPLPGGREMPVPASYNDLVTDPAEREFVGDVWYQREVHVPASWQGRRIVLRCDAATHRGTIWAGDTLVADHTGGYTPFEADVTALARCGEPLRVTVRVGNELTMATIPPGVISASAGGQRTQRYFHDFFNYAGLHRSVWLYTTPKTYIEGVAVSTDFTPATSAGRVRYQLDVAGDADTAGDAGDAATAGDARNVGDADSADSADSAGGADDAGRAAVTSVLLRDAAGQVVARAADLAGELAVPRARPWQPGDPYLYRLEVTYGEDEYCLTVGIRTVRVAADRLLLNGVPVRLRGFGMHEDVALRGKGHDDARMVRDFALLDWIGANSFRTSHYPYAEEVLDYADRKGVLVIDETPAVGLHLSLGNMGDHGARTFSPEAIGTAAAEAHLAAIGELIARDRNHPCVIAWSIANEPDTAEPAAREYFAPLVAAARALDSDPARVLRERGHRPAGSRCGQRPVRPDLRQPVLRLVRQPWGPGGRDEATGGGAQGLGAVRQAHRGDRVRRRRAAWPARTAPGGLVRGLPGGADRRVAAGLPPDPAGHRRARVELRRLRHRPGRAPSRRQPQGRVHPRPAAQSGGLAPPRAVGPRPRGRSGLPRVSRCPWCCGDS